MTQKEIRDQVENMIRMSRISEQVLGVPQFKSIHLLPYVDAHLNYDAKNIIQNHKTNNMVHQWDEKVGDNKYEGKAAYALGELLGKFELPSYHTLQTYNVIRRISMVRCYGITTDLSRVGEASLKLVAMFNDLASQSLIRAVLASFILVELVGGKIAIVSYIAVDQPNEALVQSMYGSLEFQEGGIPPEMI